MAQPSLYDYMTRELCAGGHPPRKKKKIEDIVDTLQIIAYRLKSQVAVARIL